MGTELSVRFWTKNSNPVKNFTRAIQIIQDEARLEGKWHGLTVRDINTGAFLFEGKAGDEWETAEIGTILSRFDASAGIIAVSAQNAVSVWRFEGGTAVQGHVPIWLDAWSDAHFKMTGAALAMEGNMKLNFLNSSPFTGIADDEAPALVQEVNDHVAGNLEMVTDLMFALISSDLGVEKLKCFTDAGAYHPLNAHLVYWQTPR